MYFQKISTYKKCVQFNPFDAFFFFKSPFCSHLYTDVVFRALLLGLASNLNVKDIVLDLSCCEVRLSSSESGNFLFFLMNIVGAICGIVRMLVDIVSYHGKAFHAAQHLN